MKIEVSNRFGKKLKKIYRQDKKLYEKTFKVMNRISIKPDDPSLRIHKLTGFTIPSWSLSVTEKTRILFIFTKSGILLTDIGSHDEVY